MRKKRIAAIMLALSVVTASLAGCSGNNDKEQDADAKTSEATSREEIIENKEPVTLRFSWWGGDERNEATLQVIEDFQEEYPWITIEPEFSGDDGYLEKLSTALAGGQAADIIQNGPGWMPSFVEKGDFFIDFNNYTDYIDLSGFSDELLSKGTYSDELLGLPSGSATQALLVNKTLADEIGLDFSDVTWESLIEMGEKVQQYNSDTYLLNVDTSYIGTHILRPYCMQLTGEAFIDDETKQLNCTEDQLLEVLNYIKELYDSGTVQPAGETASFDGSPQTNPKWINGQNVAVLTNSSQINNFTSANEDAEYMVVDMPKMSDESAQKNDGYSVEPPQLMCVNNESEHVEEAIMFLDYFFNNEDAAIVLKDLRSVPPTENAREICEEQGLISDLVITSVEYAMEKNGLNEMGLTTDAEIEAAMETMIESVIYGDSTPVEALSSAMEMFNSILAEK